MNKRFDLPWKGVAARNIVGQSPTPFPGLIDSLLGDGTFRDHHSTDTITGPIFGYSSSERPLHLEDHDSASSR